MLTAWLQDIYFLLALIGVGIFAGYIAGLFGIGGGTILVPVLATIFPYFSHNLEMDMHCAVGTSLALVAPAALMASLRHAKQGSLEQTDWKLWLGAVLVGVLLGVLVSNHMHGNYLKLLFALYMYIAAWGIYQRHRSASQSLIKVAFPRRGVQLGVGICIGGLSSLLGLGGGSFTIPFYNQYDVPLKKAIALGCLTGIVVGGVGAIGAIINGWALPGRPGYSLGYVNLPALLIIAPLVILCAPRGAKLSHELSARSLMIACTAFYVVLGSLLWIKLLYAYLKSSSIG